MGPQGFLGRQSPGMGPLPPPPPPGMMPQPGGHHELGLPGGGMDGAQMVGPPRDMNDNQPNYDYSPLNMQKSHQVEVC